VIHDSLSAAGVPEFTIALNNRKILDGLLDRLGLADRTGFILRSLDKLAKIGNERVKNELTAGPRRDGNSVTETAEGRDDQGELAGIQPLDERQAIQVLDFVEQGRGGAEVLTQAEAELGAHPRAAEGIKNLREILDLLGASGVPLGRLKLDLGLARGLDYYTGVVFETTVNGWERFGSIASGGRYDNLASLFTERRLPGVGASIGLDRLLALMEEAGWLKGAATTVGVLVANFPGVEPSVPVKLAARLRASGTGAEVFPEPLQIGKQMGYGSARGHKFAVIVGPDEMAREVFNLRDLATRQERKAIPWADLEGTIKDALTTGEGAGS
jgi:histidyl-tRNA synthetase